MYVSYLGVALTLILATQIRTFLLSWYTYT